jgi:hypothetical protein
MHSYNNLFNKQWVYILILIVGLLVCWFILQNYEMTYNETKNYTSSSVDYFTFQERFDYYLGVYKDKRNFSISVDDKYLSFCQNQIYLYRGPSFYPKNYRFKYGWTSPGFWKGNNNGYIVNQTCLINSADGYVSDNLPVFTKARRVGDTHGIILKLHYIRHWKMLEDFNGTIFTQFEDKIPSIFWRGNSIVGTERHKLFEDFNFHEKYNIKFILPDNYKSVSEIYNYYTVHPNFFQQGLSTLEEHLKYKYILCLEGNDVSTGLKWMLMSNSIIVMAKATKESWLMEGLLLPYVHYLPIDADFSNLDSQLTWCNENPTLCNQIPINANNYMKMFLNKENELKLFFTITKHYEQYIHLNYSYNYNYSFVNYCYCHCD